ncbi:MAG: DNA-binding protein, partial [Phaeodactylibacter sp.]|nr:DNA-binding protein [Phaeodactylibacter sp.]
GAKKFENGDIVDAHIQPGPNGGIVNLESTAILDAARRILGEAEVLS